MEKNIDKISEPKLKLKRLPLTEQVYQAIKEGIISGRWNVGDRLPSENELAQIFGVNRLTVRGALQKLNILGIVETRVGEGTFVLSFNFRKYISEVEEFTMQPEKEHEIKEFRELVEIECARLAMERGTDLELDELKRLGEECWILGQKLNESYNEGSFEKGAYVDFVNADLDFHYQICKMSHNSLYVGSFNLARASIQRYMLLALEKHYNKYISQGGLVTEFKRIYEDHSKIFDSIKNKDFEKCKQSYISMIDPDIW